MYLFCILFSVFYHCFQDIFLISFVLDRQEDQFGKCRVKAAQEHMSLSKINRSLAGFSMSHIFFLQIYASDHKIRVTQKNSCCFPFFLFQKTCKSFTFCSLMVSKRMFACSVGTFYMTQNIKLFSIHSFEKLENTILDSQSDILRSRKKVFRYELLNVKVMRNVMWYSKNDASIRKLRSITFIFCLTLMFMFTLHA